ncbi:MAG: BamA/TamA family outer membrane protein [Bacteroidota bacterium]|nr:BamA/TamA family outer membrane protein [Bacteroidota bacterium]
MRQIKIFLEICITFILLLPLGFSFAQEEHPEYELNKIKFLGNEHFSSSVLADIIISKETPSCISKELYKIYYKLGRKPSLFDSLLVSIDLNSLRLFYKDNGFFESRMSSSFFLDKEDHLAELNFSIYEGPRFTIRSYKINGIGSLPEEILSKLQDCKLDSGDYFSKTQLNEKNIALVNCLKDNGYMLAKTDIPRVDIDTLADCVDVAITVETGSRYIVDNLKIDKKGPGKDYVDDELIRRIADIKSLNYYSAYEKQRAQVRLYRTNLFSSVLISEVLKDTMNYHVPLTVSANIEALEELSPELILNNIDNSFNFGVGAVFSHKNFLGNARNFTFSGNIAVQDFFRKDVISNLHKFFNADNPINGFFDLRAALEQPYFFEEPISNKIEAYWTINKKEEYKSSSVGTKLSFDFELPKYVYLSSFRLFYSIDGSQYDFQESYIEKLFKDKWNIEVDSAKNILQKLKEKNNLQLQNNWELTSIIGTDIFINKTDDLIFPTKGYNLSFTVEEANILPYLLNKIGIGTEPKSQFYRVITSFSVFPSIYRSPLSAFGIKLKSGYLQAYAGDKSIVPLNKRFTAGGSNSVRGWSARGLKPKDKLDYNPIMQAIQSGNDISDHLIRGIPVGGTFLLEGSFESRNRIVDKFGMASFIDFGNAWEGYKEVSFNSFAVAAGFGLRYYSSFAPFRLDFGFQIIDPEDKRDLITRYAKKILRDNVTIHFGIGESF